MIDYKLTLTPFLVALCGVMLSACTTSTPEKVLEAHGDSVRNMIAEQTHTSEDDAIPLDGDKSRNVLSAYRGDIADTKKVEKEVIQIKLE